MEKRTSGFSFVTYGY